MLRIVGVQRGDRPHEEFILLQNQGGFKLALRGHAVISEATMTERKAMHLFDDDEELSTGAYVLLSTGHGRTRWGRTRDGQKVLHVYMNREACAWRESGPISVLSVQHTYAAERPLAVAI